MKRRRLILIHTSLIYTLHVCDSPTLWFSLVPSYLLSMSLHNRTKQPAENMMNKNNSSRPDQYHSRYQNSISFPLSFCFFSSLLLDCLFSIRQEKQTRRDVFGSSGRYFLGFLSSPLSYCLFWNMFIEINVYVYISLALSCVCCCFFLFCLAHFIYSSSF